MAEIAPGSEECQKHMHERILELEAMNEDVAAIKKAVEEMKEILIAWNSVKGFAETMGWLAKGIKVIAVIGSITGVFYYFLTTGHIPSSGGK